MVLADPDLLGFDPGWWQVPKLRVNRSTGSPEVYFAGRKNGRAHILKFELNHDLQPIEGSVAECMGPSSIAGSFDDEGVMPSDFLELSDGRTALFYSGWNTRNTVPYHNTTGLVWVDEGGKPVSERIGPILDRTWEFPYLAVTPTVWGEGPFHCIYVNGDGWADLGGGKYEPKYSLKYAESTDLKTWSRNPADLISWQTIRTCHSNPCHYHFNDKTIIFYCDRAVLDYRANPLNGYDVCALQLTENLCAQPVEVDWQSERLDGFNCQMRAYPEVFDWNGQTYLLTNGNGFGKTGILLSQLKFEEG